MSEQEAPLAARGLETRWLRIIVAADRLTRDGQTDENWNELCSAMEQIPERELDALADLAEGKSASPSGGAS